MLNIYNTCKSLRLSVLSIFPRWILTFGVFDENSKLKSFGLCLIENKTYFLLTKLIECCNPIETEYLCNFLAVEITKHNNRAQLLMLFKTAPKSVTWIAFANDIALWKNMNQLQKVEVYGNIILMAESITSSNIIKQFYPKYCNVVDSFPTFMKDLILQTKHGNLTKMQKLLLQVLCDICGDNCDNL
jgi:hypothetical protein